MQLRPAAALQVEIQQLAEAHWGGEYWPPLSNLARLAEELGEVARAVNQRYGEKHVKSGESQADLQEELGDALFVLFVLADSMGIDMQAGFDAAIAKARRRDAGAE
jgi:NTP pyrophosphatase (non-canonical NTP hydrolase)